ncbi:MAG: flagellar hook-basal body complex protein [Proteobacteria bacterium]|nr:flagellar hook-basal body complex protein [Pseudomonadota bacterium]MBU1715548.1 flagellar hook-basal body complex protein [Pseudomonadota bacterium]
MSYGLYSSLSALSSFAKKTENTANNVANLNTPGFKSSSVSLQDGSSQSIATAAGSSQLGSGVAISSVSQDFTQGTFESSANPTDLAIGGQGFFMLRQPENDEADRYTRAGGFRFNQEGYLTSPTGLYVQGWSLDPSTGDRQGTIGDINLGKTTPPVATRQIDMVINLDSGIATENNEVRLFDAWDGRKAAAANPTEPISSSNYEYSSAIKIYDEQGASHDITVYFDRTTNNNEWEFLVTANPLEDQRAINPDQQEAYVPFDNYNAQSHAGAGALMYGTIQFNSSGEIQNITAYEVPPDGKVDPALNDNRIVLSNSDTTYSVPYNFTGDSVNQRIKLNFGASFSGQTTNQSQIITSDQGGVNGSGIPITAQTRWNDVYDANGNKMTTGDTLNFNGYRHDGSVASLNYAVNDTNSVQDLLNQLGTAFNSTATINSSGQLQLKDNQGGDSGLSISGFNTITASSADPFGSQINITTSKQEIISTGRALTNGSGTPPVISENTNWNQVFDSFGSGPVVTGSTFSFDGTKGDGTTVSGQTFTVNATQSPNNNVQDLLDWLENTFDAEATIDNAGQLMLTERVADSSTRSSQLSINSVAYGGGAPSIFGAAAFTTIAADLNSEDGSRTGDVVSMSFQPGELASTQYANNSTTIFQNQDGFAAGFLQSITTNNDGVITGRYSNGQVLERAQVSLASFNNPEGLSMLGGNLFSATSESGSPTSGAPGTSGLGSIAPNALEQSNVELSQELSNMILTKRFFQANLKIMQTEDEMLGSLLDIFG